MPLRFASTAAASVIDYKHRFNLHTLEGPQAALPIIFQDGWPASVLDVGCGTGTWLKAIMENGIEDAMGLDGIAVDKEELLIPCGNIQVQDFTRPWQLGRRFAAALCLEVAEHLDAPHGERLIQSLTDHADVVVFSAAIPGQPGQHHVNCQWADYWQALFNAQGYVCDDAVRWRLWDEPLIEPWYRQNIFIARRDPAAAGREPRLRHIIHPAMLPQLMSADRRRLRSGIETGSLSARWYLRTPLVALWSKLARRAMLAPSPA